jgi:hypothetical protein
MWKISHLGKQKRLDRFATVHSGRCNRRCRVKMFLPLRNRLDDDKVIWR